MVFTKPLQYARLGLQKAIPHGSAQSLVAATQSSSVSHQTSAYLNRQSYTAKASPAHQHLYVHHAQSASNSGSSLIKPAQPDSPSHDAGLAAYYAAWHKHQLKAKDDEWNQFQFAKRIGWKAPTTVPEAPKTSHGELTVEPAARPARVPLERSHSANVVDDIKANPVLEAAAVAEANAAIAKEIESLQEAAIAPVPAPADVNDVVLAASVADSVRTPSVSFESINESPLTKATSLADVEQYSDQLDQLANQQQYDAIPAVFEKMLQDGVQPTASAYNSLLLAAIHLPRAKHQVVPKALDVYADMLRRQVTPNVATYNILVVLLADRALEVQYLKEQLELNRARYSSVNASDNHLFDSDTLEAQILKEDDSLSLALKFFEAASALPNAGAFSSYTCGVLLAACAKHGRTADIAKIIDEFGTKDIPTAVRASVITALGEGGELKRAVSVYEAYKALAIAHDRGELAIERSDAEIYASVVAAYTSGGQADRGLKFMGKIEETLSEAPQLPPVRDAIALEALIPHWIKSGNYAKAIEHSSTLSPAARALALSAICVAAADKNDVQAALQAFGPWGHAKDGEAVAALLAMHIRQGNLQAAGDLFNMLRSQPSVAFLEPCLAYATSLIQQGQFERGIASMNQMLTAFVRSGNLVPETAERVDEAVGAINASVFKMAAVPPPSTGLELLRMMTATGTEISTDIHQILASFGPQDIARCSPVDIDILAQVQAKALSSGPVDAVQSERLMHLAELLASVGAIPEATGKLIDDALAKIGRPELSARWYSLQHPTPMTPMSPVMARNVYTPTPSDASFGSGEHYDPYEASTDVKGSIQIADVLDKPYGQHTAHLNEAMTKFRNMRRVGRHPRYVTYAKLIAAAAKDNRIALAQDILAMAKQDVPFVPDSPAVRHGWSSILDAMVAACLNVGRRDLAAKHHHDLTNMGSAPSANTFGLYITTLKESTKTFDEATEAVKIFHRAKAEGVEPSSFLYNALIGKLGKARRIDDCLFYFAEMRNRGIRPTSVTYGTVVNALCRVSDDHFAEELFEEMESMPNYKPRPAPYNSLMQYFLTTKRDRSKVLAYYQRMQDKNIAPTMHTYKLLIDTHATLEPADMAAAEAVLDSIRASGQRPEAIHYASLIHAKGCVQRDLAGARATFDNVISSGLAPPQASLYQALFESMVANHAVEQTPALVDQMYEQGVAMTPYIANTLIHGWATLKDISKAKAIFDSLGRENREPSTYEAMTRAFLAVEDQGSAKMVVGEALRRGYPSAVSNRICELVMGGEADAAAAVAVTA